MQRADGQGWDLQNIRRFKKTFQRHSKETRGKSRNTDTKTGGWWLCYREVRSSEN